jgi:hypothetical protein
MPFLLAVLTTNPLGCAEGPITPWPFARDKNGYPVCHPDGLAGRQRPVHQLVCEWANGPRPSPSHVASHLCGNGHLGCFAPVDLAWQTLRQDRADRARHGRWPVGLGERNGVAKLTDEMVLAIRAEYARGVLQRELAVLYGVEQSTISRVVRNLGWTHLSAIAAR